MRILIIEDETRLAVTVADLLEHAGYTADTQKNGLTGLEDRICWLGSGADYYLTKPFENEELLLSKVWGYDADVGERENSFIVEF